MFQHYNLANSYVFISSYKTQMDTKVRSILNIYKACSVRKLPLKMIFFFVVFLFYFFMFVCESSKDSPKSCPCPSLSLRSTHRSKSSSMPALSSQSHSTAGWSQWHFFFHFAVTVDNLTFIWIYGFFPGWLSACLWDMLMFNPVQQRSMTCCGNQPTCYWQEPSAAVFKTS